MGVITKKTIEVYLYTDSKGNQKPLKELADGHLLNALLFAQRGLDRGEYQDELEKEDIEIMKGEILMRMHYGNN